MDLFGFVPLVYNEADIICSHPINCDFIILFKDLFEMVSFVLSGIFDAKVINDETKL